MDELAHMHGQHEGGHVLEHRDFDVLPLAGLVAYAVYPGLASIILLDGVRKVVHYSVMKPARESIFSQLDGDVKFRAKAFIDAFVFRSGSAAAAGYFAVSHAFGADMRVSAAICLAVSLVWLAGSYKLGCAADALGERQAASGDSATVERGGGAELATAERGSGAEELAPTSPSSSIAAADIGNFNGISPFWPL